MPWGLKRYQQTRQLHFVTFSCYHRKPLLADPQACDIFVEILETVRRWYGFWLIGYVVMPEHVHLLLSEPERQNLALVLQMLKQMVSRRLRPASVGGPSCREAKGGNVQPQPFWQARHYDFNVWSEQKRVEKLRYIHRNPVRRGLVERAEGWLWGRFRHYLTGEEGAGPAPAELPPSHPCAKNAQGWGSHGWGMQTKSQSTQGWPPAFVPTQAKKWLEWGTRRSVLKKA